MREAVEHGVEGLVCPTRSPRALADALAALHADPALARRMGEAGRARVEAAFALPDQIAAWERLYDEVLPSAALDDDEPALAGGRGLDRLDHLDRDGDSREVVGAVAEDPLPGRCVERRGGDHADDQ